MSEPDALANEGWVNNRWRPAMAWSYFAVCLCDFIAFPIFNAVWFSPEYHEWHPLTLQGGGLYHMAMGAIIGVTAWQRTQEKIAMYQHDSPLGGVTTEHTMERTSSVTAAPAAPAKVDIKTDTVNVSTNSDPKTPSRAD